MDTFRSRMRGEPDKPAPEGRGIWLPIVGLVVGTLIPVLVVLLIFAFSRPQEGGKLQRARMDVQALAQQAEIFMLNNEAPGSLEALAEQQPNGGPPLVPRDKLRDPWGNIYQLDMAGVRPVVWTVTPDGVRITSADK